LLDKGVQFTGKQTTRGKEEDWYDLVYSFKWH